MYRRRVEGPLTRAAQPVSATEDRSASASLETGPPVEECWDLSPVYADEGSFLEDRRQLEAALSGLEALRGSIAGGPQALLAALEAITGENKRLARLHAWAGMRSDIDLRNAPHQAARQEIELLATEFSRRTSWLRPELLALPAGLTERWIAEEPRLGPWTPYLRNVERLRPHVLAPSEERIVAEAGLLVGGPETVFGILQNAEIPRPEFVRADGSTTVVTPAEFSRLRTTDDRGERARVFEAYFGSYAPFAATLGANLFDGVKGHVFHARVRGYPSCLEAALDADNVPVAVYTNLVASVRRHLSVLHRYFRLRAKALGLATVAYHDLHCPIARGPRRTYTVADAAEVVREAMAVLGEEYGGALRVAFEERWVDWHPRPGKRSGAYASGAAYDVHPYMLLNYTGDYDGVSTLAHEAGHALHSLFSNRAQPYACAAYSIFVAEVASTFNETLLNETLMRKAASRDERIFLLASWLDGMRATLFRQTFFAEFELRIHERAERGEALTGESLGALYLALLREYQGHDAGACHVDDLYAIEWAGVPHFYYDFYVYQYATGIVAATSLATDVLAGRVGARDRYLEFLRSGGSDYPLALLRRAGVDLETAAPYEASFQAMSRKLDELESLLES